MTFSPRPKTRSGVTDRDSRANGQGRRRGIQGYGATIVRRIDGDYFAVMGLSLVRLVALMREIGVGYDFPR